MAEDQQERQIDPRSAYTAEGVSSTSLSDRDQEIRELRQQVQALTGILEAISLTHRQLSEREVQSDWFSQHWKSWQDSWWHDKEWTTAPRWAAGGTMQNHGGIPGRIWIAGLCLSLIRLESGMSQSPHVSWVLCKLLDVERDRSEMEGDH